MQQDDFSLMGWLLDHAWAPVAGAVTALWTFHRRAHDETRKVAAKALAVHEREDQRQHQEMNDELTVQRGHIAKIFDKIEAHAQRSEDRHTELLNALHTGLNAKADK